MHSKFKAKLQDIANEVVIEQLQEQVDDTSARCKYLARALSKSKLKIKDLKSKLKAKQCI